MGYLGDLVHRARGTYVDPEQNYDLKQQGLEALLGPMADFVGHAIVPYAVGGTVDMYYFPQPDGSTAIATMALLDHCGRGPIKSSIGTYELLGFTRHAVSTAEDSDFLKTERMLCGIFTAVGRYSQMATLEPLQTSEIPNDDRDTRYVLFDNYFDTAHPLTIGPRSHGLLLCIALHESELAFGRADGTASLKERLQAEGAYPYSDLDREPVA